MNKISSFATAQLLIINAALYGEEKSKEISRYRFSRQSLRNISGMGRLSGPFIEDLMGDLQRLGWIFIEFSDSDCAIMMVSKITVWPKLSSKRLNTNDQLWTLDEDLINEAYIARFPTPESPEIEA